MELRPGKELVLRCSEDDMGPGVYAGVAVSTAIADIRAMRAASNAAIAGRDVAGSVAAMLPGYRGTWARSVAHRPVDSVTAALTREPLGE